MPELFLPTTVQVDPQVRRDLTAVIWDGKIQSLWHEGVEVVRGNHGWLHDLLLFEDEDGNPLLEEKPARVLRISSIIASLAYVKSGYDKIKEDGVLMNDALLIASEDAEFEGIPDAYLQSFAADRELQLLTEVMVTAPEMQVYIEDDRYQQLAAVAAGCTRHYLQYAVAA